MITQLPQTPNVGQEVPNSLWKWLIAMGNRIRQLIEWVNGYAAPTGVVAHASTHATAGSDPVSAADIGAAAADHSHNNLGAGPGDIKTSARKTPEDGWLKCNGQTIGDGSSGGTARANADTQDLFAILWTDWENAVLPIQDSAGSTSTRGASAADDFAAHKRLPLPDIRDEHVRGWADDRAGTPNTSALFGSKLVDAVQGHKHKLPSAYSGTGYALYGTISPADGSTFNHGDGVTNVTGHLSSDPYTDGTNGTPRTASETRVRVIFLSYFIKY